MAEQFFTLSAKATVGGEGPYVAEITPDPMTFPSITEAVAAFAGWVEDGCWPGGRNITSIEMKVVVKEPQP